MKHALAVFVFLVAGCTKKQPSLVMEGYLKGRKVMMAFQCDEKYPHYYSKIAGPITLDEVTVKEIEDLK